MWEVVPSKEHPEYYHIRINSPSKQELWQSTGHWESDDDGEDSTGGSLPTEKAETSGTKQEEARERSLLSTASENSRRQAKSNKSNSGSAEEYRYLCAAPYVMAQAS